VNQPITPYLPHNGQDHDNDMRAIAMKHMGMGQGNPSQWVVMALHEAFQRGFGMGLSAGQQRQQPDPGRPGHRGLVERQALDHVPERRRGSDMLQVIEDATIKGKRS